MRFYPLVFIIFGLMFFVLAYYIVNGIFTVSAYAITERNSITFVDLGNTTNFVGRIQVRGYSFMFTDYVGESNNGSITGNIDRMGLIKILTGRSMGDIYRTCVHEVLHNVIGVDSFGNNDFHEAIYRITGFVIIPVCNELIDILLGKDMNRETAYTHR